MLTIRLQRVGRRNHAEFRVVATESTRGPKSANYVEMLGSYNPHRDEVTIDAERAKYWLSMGAKASGTVHNLLVSQKIIDAKKINVLPKKSPPQKEKVKEEASKSEARAEEQTESAAESTPESADAPAEGSSPEPIEEEAAKAE